MDIFKVFETDIKAEVEGKWFSLFGAEFLIAHQGNSAFEQYNAELLRPYRVEISSGTFSREKRQELMIQAFAKKILLGWKNVMDQDGNEIQYSEAQAAKLMTVLPHFAQQIFILSANWEFFRKADNEAALKN